MSIIGMSYGQIRQRQEALTAAANAGTLNEQQLDEAVELVVEDPGDGPAESIGTQWIWRHAAEFAKAVKDITAFMRRHLENRYFAALVVLDEKLLQLLPAPERATYVRDSLLLHGAWDMSVISVALKVGVSREVLAQSVLDALEAVTEEKLSYANFVGDFLEYGCGDIKRANPLADSLRGFGGEDEAHRIANSMQRTAGLEFAGRRVAVALERPEDDRRNWRLEQDTAWAVLDDVQFAQAVRICVGKSPEKVLHHHDRIRLRLDNETLRAIMIEAADRLNHVCCLDVLRTLPIETRVALARRIKSLHFNAEVVTAQFLTELILVKGVEFYGEVLPIVKQIDSSVLYRNTFSILSEAKRNSGEEGNVAAKLEQLYAEQCRAQGYLFGVIEEGTYTNRRTGRGERQWQVRNGGATYVRDNHQHRYFPKAGDHVLFKPSLGYWLTPNVEAVMFYPARYGGED